MADAYWRYSDSRQSALPPIVGKRPRSDYEVPGGHDLPGYYGRDDERHHVIRDAESIGTSYDRYLRNTQLTPYGVGETARPGAPGGRPVDDPHIMGIGPGADPAMSTKSPVLRAGSGRPGVSLPSDASNTLFVEGLPPNCSRREVAHIFRPFVGYKEVRLVTKESRRSGGDPLVLCFVDFQSPAHAATAMDALQGYRFDEHDRDSVNLRLQFARYPGARSGGGHRGRR